MTTTTTTDERWLALADDALRGLTADEKQLPPKWFYDARGSELFDAICEQPEYYLTRAEADLLRDRGDELAAAFPARELIELGSGSSTKTPLLLDPLLAGGSLRRYVPLDVSASVLAQAAESLAGRYPSLEITPTLLDFTTQLGQLPHVSDGDRLVALLGSTIGNLDPASAQAFLASLRDRLDASDALLIGVDLVKDSRLLEAAYNDAAGVTAAFNRNMLAVVNRELDGDFDLTAFAHDASWNADLEQIETRLRAVGEQRIHLAGLNLNVSFRDGEAMLTEISRKFRRTTVAEMLESGGFVLDRWIEQPRHYALALARPA